MPILQIPIASILAWLLAFAFAGAGIFNAMGGVAVQARFLSWGYPAWWNFLTAALEILSAALIILPDTRIWGLAVGAIVLIGAISTVAWRQDYKHLPPPGRWRRSLASNWLLCSSIEAFGKSKSNPFASAGISLHFRFSAPS